MERPDSDAPINQWADYLADLLSRAKDAAESQAADRIEAVSKELLAFHEYSPLGSDLLDGFASQAAIELSQSDLGRRLDAISKRDADFSEIYQEIQAATPVDTQGSGASYPTRTGNEIQMFVDGQKAYGQIAVALQNAKKFIYATVSFGDQNFLMVPETRQTMFDLFRSRANAGVDVRLVVWQPASSTPDTIPDPAPAMIAGINDRPGNIQARWDTAKGYAGWYQSPNGQFEPLYLVFPAKWGCHHQKTYVMDDGAGGVVAFVGGINPVQSYWDTATHDSLDVRRVAKGEDLVQGLEKVPPLHDIFYQIKGPAAGDVIANFVERYNGASHPYDSVTTNVVPQITADTIAELADGTEVQILRTIAPNTYSATHGGDRGIRELYLMALDEAAQGSLIYVENQYFFDYGIISKLYAAAARGAKVIVVLTSAPDEGTLQGQVECAAERLCNAIQEICHRVAAHENVVLLTLGNSRQDPRAEGKFIYSETYIHSKTMAVLGPGGTRMLGGSANIAFTSMWFHSEMNIAITDAKTIKNWVSRLWSEHLQIPITNAMVLVDTPVQALAVFKQQAASNNSAMAEGKMPLGRVYDWSTKFPRRLFTGIEVGQNPK